MKSSASDVLSIGGLLVGKLSMEKISAVLGKPDQYESISSPDSNFDQRWIWNRKGITAVLNGDGGVIRVIVDPNLTPVAIDEKLVPSTKDLFLTRFSNSEKSDHLCELTLGSWQIEFAFQPMRKGKTTGPNSRRIKLITIRSR